MNIRSKILIILTLTTLVSHSALTQVAQYLSFFDGDTLHLRWAGYTDSDIRGYHVYRMQEGEQDWQMLTTVPLQITMDLQEVTNRVGHKSALYFSLFGIQQDSENLNVQMVRDVMGDPRARGFLEVMSTVNPEFGDLLGLMFHDGNLNMGSIYRYRIEVVKDAGSEIWIETDWLTTDKPGTVPEAKDFVGKGVNGKIALSWEKNSELLRSGQVVTYRIYRADEMLGPYSPRNVFGILPINIRVGDNEEDNDVEQYIDDYLENGATFYYFITAVNAFGIESERSITLEITVGADEPPLAPRNLSGRMTGGIVRIEWDHPAGQIDGFNLYRSGDPESGFSLTWPPDKMIQSTRTFYLDDDIVEGQTYYYFIISTRGNLAGPPSDTLSVFIPDFTPPDPPQNIVAETTKQGILISWTANEENDILGYEIERTSDSTFSRKLQVNAMMIHETKYLDTISELSPTTYGYQVFAYDQNYNRSYPSDFIKARMPDIVAPQTPFVTSFTSDGGTVDMSWTPCLDREFLEFRIYQRIDSGDFRQVVQTRELNHTFTLEGYGNYHFALSAVDSAMNESQISREYQYAYLIEDYPLPPSGFTALLTSNNQVHLTWQAVEGDDIRAFIISRKDNDTNHTIDLGEFDPGQIEYVDKRTLRGKTYTYSIQTLNNNWKISPKSTVEITIK